MSNYETDYTYRREVIERHLQSKGSIASAARELSMPERTLQQWWKNLNRDPAVQAGMDAIGTQMVPHSMWTINPPKDGMPGHSIYHLIKEDRASFLDEVRAAISDAFLNETPKLPPRFQEKEGLLVVLDPADVHIGKLSVASETGYHYDIEVAAHRLVEGSRVLLTQAKALGATRVCFIVGNDIAHIDSPKRTTTNGTPQDTDGSIFSIYRAGTKGYRGIVEIALEMELSVDLVYCPSNHDWVLGFAIVQELAAWFRNHPNFTASEYNISERHRKYYRYGKNLMVFTHMDYGKEADLPQVMLVEARQHIADCPHRYGYLHHFHHRMKRSLGVRPMEREKDHIAMTVTFSGPGAQEGDNLEITYVRSPSPPDGWHSRSMYLNRQAVEAFLHHPEEGRKHTLTEWF